MDNEGASGTAQVPVPTDSTRNLYEVEDSEWIAECERWVEVEVKRTFSLVKDGVVLDADALKQACLDLSGLSNALMVPADKYGLESKPLWEFGAHLRSYAMFAKLQHLANATAIAQEVAGLVMSLRNRLILAQQREAVPSRVASEWESLGPDERRAEILSTARHGSFNTITALCKALTRSTGGKPDTIRSWISRNKAVLEEVHRIIHPSPAR